MTGSDLDALLVVVIVLVIGLAVIAALAFTGAVTIRIARGGKRADSKNAEEARLMQEIYVGLEKLNDRVESLETIVLDERERKNLV